MSDIQYIPIKENRELKKFIFKIKREENNYLIGFIEEIPDNFLLNNLKEEVINISNEDV